MPSRGQAPKLIQWRTPAIATRGPKPLQRVLLAQPQETDNIPPPAAYLGTNQDGRSLRELIRLGDAPEWHAAWAALTFGLYLDRDIYYQVNELGGRLLRGGSVLDFGLPGFSQGWNVQGKYFHFRTTAEQGASRLVRAQLASRGIKVIFLDEFDLMTKPRAVVQAALRGEDVSMMAHD